MVRFGAVLVTLTVVLAACGDGDLPPAAEPPDAPSDAEPAGEVIEIGARPEGVVADAETGLVAVAVRDPHALVLIEASTGEEAQRVELPAPLRHLQLAGPGGPALLPVEGADALLFVDLTSGEISDRVDTGDFPHDATMAANGRVFVTNEFDPSIGVIEDGRMARTLTGHTQPGGIAAAGDQVGVIDVRQNDLTVYDAESLREVGRLDAGDGPTHVLAGQRGSLVVSDTRGDRLLVFETGDQPRQAAELELTGGPYGLAYDVEQDLVWVTLTGRNEVVGVDLSAEQPTEVARLPTVRQPNTIAVDSETGRLFITGTEDGVLQLVDP